MLYYLTLQLCMLLMILYLGGNGDHAILLDSAALHAIDDIYHQFTDDLAGWVSFLFLILKHYTFWCFNRF